MLFNATQSEELRVAIVDGQKLLDLDIENAAKEQRKGNIYKGVVTRVEPSLEAAFVDYGAIRHGFLPFKEVSRSYFVNPQADPAKVRINQALKEGQEVLVQVDKDERGNKGAALTTFIGLAGRYLVLMPNNPRGGGVSRRIEGEDRNELRELISRLNVPSGMSVIARTAGIGRSAEELDWDLNYLVQLWTAISSASEQQAASFLIYQESSLVIRAIRDHFHQEIGELLIDTDAIYQQAVQFMGHVMPNNVNLVKKYTDQVPLFSRFQIEQQIETAHAREVMLPSGGAIIIDRTEAIVAIDVNSAKSTRGSDIEETAFRTNLEAAEEITRQLRLRDLGGLVVIDFIDMENNKNQREVENYLRNALSIDRARVQVGKISQFGLLELSRQRLNSSLGENNSIICPRCNGTGNIRSTESTALQVLRILQDEAIKENTATIHAQVPVDVATYLLNEKRDEFRDLEKRLNINCLLIPNISFSVPQYEITRVRHDDKTVSVSNEKPSYKLATAPESKEYTFTKRVDSSKINEPVIKGVPLGKPAPGLKRKGVFRSFLELISHLFSGKTNRRKKDHKNRPKNNRSRRDRRPERRADRKNENRRKEKDKKIEKNSDHRKSARIKRSSSTTRENTTGETPIQEPNELKPKRRRRRMRTVSAEESAHQKAVTEIPNKKQSEQKSSSDSFVESATPKTTTDNQQKNEAFSKLKETSSTEGLNQTSEMKSENNPNQRENSEESQRMNDIKNTSTHSQPAKKPSKIEKAKEKDEMQTPYTVPDNMQMIETKISHKSNLNEQKSTQDLTTQKPKVRISPFENNVSKDTEQNHMEQIETKKDGED